MFGYIAVKDTPPVMRNNKEAIEKAEGECRHGKEFHCCNGLPMVAQKRRPALCRLMTPRCFLHPSQDPSFRNIEAEHSQLAMNARRIAARTRQAGRKY